jgi:acetyl-CoA carboxylase biotin carboxylase subunit
MRLVFDPSTFDESVRSAQSEAKSAFGDGRVYVEKFLEEPRHVEFQIMADSHGNVLHLFDRECSIQRRHQKVVEEAPCAILDDKMRAEMAHAAVLAAKGCGYVGAGTIEFLVDKHKNFYFMEMNTRIQVEHPVTEEVTGYDLIRSQIEIAAGIPLRRKALKMRGHSIECRINAEDPEHGFRPSAGKITVFNPPGGHSVRVDTHAYSGYVVPPNYDSMIAKLIVSAPTRPEAIARMYRALDEFIIEGIKTTIPYHKQLLKDPNFINGNFNTSYLEKSFQFDPTIS